MSFTFNIKYPLGYLIGLVIPSLFIFFKIELIFSDNKVPLIHPTLPPLFALLEILNLEAAVLKSFNLLQEAYLKYINEFPNTKLSIFPNNKVDKIFKDYYFILSAMNGWHALRPHNRKFY